MQLNERIIRWRESRDMSQADLARATELSTAAVSQWETGHTQPTHRSVEAICSALGISVSEFWAEPPERKARAS